MRPFLKILCFSLLAVCTIATAKAASGSSIATVGIPEGFLELTRPREALVDVYFGGRKVGEARIVSSPGSVRFRDPDQILEIIPNLIPSPVLASAIAAELPANRGRVCPSGITNGCGTISPHTVGVIFDEDRFRLDLFVNPMWLRPTGFDQDPYLDIPDALLSLTSSLGFALSGSSAQSAVYNLQNRTIAAFRNARIRSDTSYASDLGLLLDNLVAEIDQPGLRYSGGLFWAPGLDLTGQRRILGLGLTTQFDTRADRDQLQGTPLVLFLPQAARVDILVDGRLIGSGLYEAGNNVIDTTGMPMGSYSLVLRIHELNGATREERRFFAKNVQIAPLGQPFYFAYAGVLANTRSGRAISLSKDFFYQLGTARRLSDSLAVDASLIGVGDKPLIEIGGWLISPLGRVRAAGLISPRGNGAALVQLASAQTGRLTVNFDVRRVWSRNGPLLPVSDYVPSFDTSPTTDAQRGEGSYTQASGSIGYRLGDAYLSIVGSLRKDKGLPMDFSIGPNVSWPILNNNWFQLVVQADAQRTRLTTAGYLGVRMMVKSRSYSLSSTAGRRSLSGDRGPDARRSRFVSSTTAQYSYQDDNQTELALAAGLDRDLASTSARAGAILYSRFGSARGEIVKHLEGDRRTQYAVTLQTGAVLNRDNVIVGGRNLEQSALIVSLEGTAGDAEFEVIVDDQSRGRIKKGGRLPLFLQPYRAYSVQIRPIDAAAVSFDTASREVTLYPGNVTQLRWRVEQLVTIFGRAVLADGTPVANALITASRSIGHSDEQGHFQIDVTPNESLAFAVNGKHFCNAAVSTSRPKNGFASIGRVVCQ